SELQGESGQHDQQRVQERVPEAGVAEQCEVVVEGDELPRRRLGQVVIEGAEVEAVGEGIELDERQEQEARKQEPAERGVTDSSRASSAGPRLPGRRRRALASPAPSWSPPRSRGASRSRRPGGTPVVGEGGGPP